MITSTAQSPPQVRHHTTTSRMMWTMVVVLLPAFGWGVFQFGLRSIAVVGTAVVTAVAAEFVAVKLLRRSLPGDGHSLLLGLLIGLSLPVSVPLFVPVVASLFALLVVKWSFGGPGAYWMNPALAGWSFAYISFPQAWTGVDAMSGATPLSLAAGTAPDALGAARQAGIVGSVLDDQVTDWLNAHLLSRADIDLPGGYIDLFLGTAGGAIGEVSAALLLLGSIILLGGRVVRWHIPAAMFATYALLIRLFGGLQYGTGLFSGDVLFHTLSGGFLLALFFLAPEPGSAPYTRGGMWIFGVLVGGLAALFRLFGAAGEGVAFAVIIANICVPLIHRYTQPRRFGQQRRGVAS